MVTTSTLPCVRPAAVAVAVAVPEVSVDCSIIVPTAFAGVFVVAPNRVPVPLMLNVIVFVALVTGLLFVSESVAVISDVLVPFATIDADAAVTSTLFTVDGGGVVTTLTLLEVSPVAVAVAVAVPEVSVD